MRREGWEVDWTHPNNNGSRVYARNPLSHLPKAREWHSVTTGHLRLMGHSTPTFRKDAWEVDWEKRDRNGKFVWARNPLSKMPSAHAWHWVDQHTLIKGGLKWRPVTERTGRWKNKRGYVLLSRVAMSTEEIAFAEKHALFNGQKKAYVWEHRLVAFMANPQPTAGRVVRHLNGIPGDNRSENLVIGTTQENTMDHNTARLQAIYWRTRYESLVTGRERSLDSQITAPVIQRLIKFVKEKK